MAFTWQDVTASNLSPSVAALNSVGDSIKQMENSLKSAVELQQKAAQFGIEKQRSTKTADALQQMLGMAPDAATADKLYKSGEYNRFIGALDPNLINQKELYDAAGNMTKTLADRAKTTFDATNEEASIKAQPYMVQAALKRAQGDFAGEQAIYTAAHAAGVRDDQLATGYNESRTAQLTQEQAKGNLLLAQGTTANAPLAVKLNAERTQQDLDLLPVQKQHALLGNQSLQASIAAQGAQAKLTNQQIQTGAISLLNTQQDQAARETVAEIEKQVRNNLTVGDIPNVGVRTQALEEYAKTHKLDPLAFTAAHNLIKGMDATQMANWKSYTDQNGPIGSVSLEPDVVIGAMEDVYKTLKTNGGTPDEISKVRRLISDKVRNGYTITDEKGNQEKVPIPFRVAAAAAAATLSDEGYGPSTMWRESAGTFIDKKMQESGTLLAIKSRQEAEKTRGTNFPELYGQNPLGLPSPTPAGRPTNYHTGR